MINQEGSNTVFRGVVFTLSLARTERQRYVLARLITLVSSSSAFLSIVFAIAIHAWTVILAYNYKGIWSALATALLPLIAELYWLFAHGSYAGSFFNLYTYGFIGLICTLYILNKLKPIDVHAGRW